MSLYAQYISEREGFEIVESEHGFATYKIQGHECYLRDIYVTPEKRKTRLAWDMADEVVRRAKARGCTVLLGSVSPEANGVDISHKALVAYGFKPFKQLHNIFLYKKDI